MHSSKILYIRDMEWNWLSRRRTVEEKEEEVEGKENAFKKDRKFQVLVF